MLFSVSLGRLFWSFSPFEKFNKLKEDRSLPIFLLNLKIWILSISKSTCVCTEALSVETKLTKKQCNYPCSDNPYSCGGSEGFSAYKLKECKFKAF